MIIIAPCSRPLRDGSPNPKSYPYWKELCELLIEKGYEVVQVGTEEETKYVDDFRVLDFKGLEKLLKECDTYITIDSFAQHLGWYVGKQGIVIFSISDPNLFGHKENINIVNRSYLRPNQFDIYEGTPYNKEAFIQPKALLEGYLLIR